MSDDSLVQRVRQKLYALIFLYMESTEDHGAPGRLALAKEAAAVATVLSCLERHELT